MPFTLSLSSSVPQKGQALPPAPPTKAIPPRTLFYGLLIITAIWTTFLAPIVANSNGESPTLHAIVTGVGVSSGVLSIFVAVLLGFGSSDPEEGRPHLLSLCYAHVFCFSFIASIWSALGIYLIVGTKSECRHGTPRCQPAILLTTFSFLTSLFSLLSAATVTCAVYVSDLPWSSHVEKARSSAAHGKGSKETAHAGPNTPQQPPMLIEELAPCPLTQRALLV